LFLEIKTKLICRYIVEQITWVWNYMKGRRAVFIGGLVLTIVTSLMRVINPMLSQQIIDNVIIPRNTDPLVRLLIIMMIVQLVRLCLTYLTKIMMEIASTDVMTRVRRDMYETVQHQDYRFFGLFPVGNLMTRLTQDLDRLRHTVAWVSYQFIGAVVLFISTFTFFMIINWQLALCLVSITPIILYISHRFKKRLRPRFQLLRQKLTALGIAVTENIVGNRVVRSFAREEYEKEKIEKHNAEYRDTSCENALIVAKYQPFLETASQIFTVIMLVAGGFFLIKEWMTPGEYMAFSSLTWALYLPMSMLGPLLADIEQYTASGEMIREVLEAPKGICDAADAVEIPEKPKGKIEFKNVNLTINGTVILEDISFKIEAGSTLGILGSTGAGKTSLVNILARYYESNSGETLLDGVDITRYKISSLRRHIGLAMQDVFLFSDSVKGNIAYGANIDPEKEIDVIRKRAVQADADDFITAMSNGYDTLIGERGVGISGGQRQRIALARALAAEPAILVLDDTTSAVDTETEQYIQKQLKNLDFPCTKIIIAQRISSLMDADMILVMDKGRIIERGTHDELLAKRGFYHHIWSLQYNTMDIKQTASENFTESK
jgi:ATP-binding cassette subfamily B protein